MWVTLLAIVLLWIFAWLSMLVETGAQARGLGLLIKFIAIPMFIFCLPMISLKWAIINDTTGITTNVFLPTLTIQAFFFVDLMFVYVATLNVFAFVGRDWVGRRKRPRK